MTIARYVKDVRDFLEPYFKRGPILQSKERCAITFNSKSVDLVNIYKTEEQAELIFADRIQFDKPENLQDLLSDINQRYLLSSTPIYWLLTPEDYQLFVIEPLPVKEDEFIEALKWRARTLINYPVEEALIDYFLLPPKKGATNPMLAMIVAKQQDVNPMIKAIRGSGLNLNTIYIPELALHNLAALYENDEKSTAVIYFYNKGAILNISSQKTLYFTRRLNWTSSTATDPENQERVCLDIMRYFDFFQSQWRLTSPSRIFILAEENMEDFTNSLSQHLSVTVGPFDIKTISNDKKTPVEVPKSYLLTYGCALREENVDVKTGR